MAWFHFIAGILLFIVFAITGGYMRADFPDKEIIPQDLRLLMRSRHIYILFSSFVHIVLGVYLKMRPAVWQRVLQYAGSVLFSVAGGLLIYAWYVETYRSQHFSDISRWGIYLSLAGVGLHLVGGLAVKK